MKAVLHTGKPLDWTGALGDVAWPLLPLGNRPFLTYWLEFCVDAGVHEVRIVLGEHAEQIEAFVEEGTRWGLDVGYSFLKPGQDPDDYLRRDPSRWEDGLLYLREPLFLRKEDRFSPEALGCAETLVHREEGRVAGFITRSAPFLQRYLAGREDPAVQPLSSAGVCPERIDSVSSYYALNMRLVGGESVNYLTPGYKAIEGSYIGYDVAIPPSVSLHPPIMVGNHCRIGELVSIGPKAVVGDRVVIDRQCDLSECVVLDDSYIGRNLELKNKIVAGSRLVDPEDGSFMDVDSLLLADVRGKSRGGDVVRGVLGWVLALVIASVMAPFFVLAFLASPLGGFRFAVREIHGKGGRLVRLTHVKPASEPPSTRYSLMMRFLLDRYPSLLQVLTGQLWLCGHEPEEVGIEEPRREGWATYFPAVFSSSGLLPFDPDPAARQAEELYYVYHRSLWEDLRILFKSMTRRLFSVGDWVAHEKLEGEAC